LATENSREYAICPAAPVTSTLSGSDYKTADISNFTQTQLSPRCMQHAHS